MTPQVVAPTTSTGNGTICIQWVGISSSDWAIIKQSVFNFVSTQSVGQQVTIATSNYSESGF